MGLLTLLTARFLCWYWYPPFNHSCIEWHFQESDKFFNLRCRVLSCTVSVERQNWRCGMLVRASKGAIGMPVRWTHGASKEEFRVKRLRAPGFRNSVVS